VEWPFEELDVEPDADEETVERAFRRRAKETHPDRGGSAAEFQRVREAYEAIVSGEATPSGAPLSEAGSDGGDRTGRRPRPSDLGTRAPGVVAPTSDPGPERARVEYLDYEALTDHGWSLDDEALFERAAAADLAPDDHGHFLADGDEHLLEAAETQGLRWPFACRGGACVNCAVYLAEGDVEVTVDNVLSDDVVAAGFRLSCICKPASERLRIVHNVKHRPELERLRLPATRFERVRSGD